MRIEVEISDTQGHVKVDRSAIADLVRTVLRSEKRERATISIALVDNATIHAVNRTHLHHDWPTDVISFPLSDPDDPVLAGELVVSAEMADSCARERKIEPRDELALYVVHGVLHLCGYDDRGEADARIMRRREQEILSEAGRKNPFPLVGQTQVLGDDEAPPERKLSSESAIDGTSCPRSRAFPQHSEPQPCSG